MDEQILEKWLDKKTETIKLMDEFEKRNESHKKIYTTLKLVNVFCIQKGEQLFWISLYIQRKPKEIACIESSLTFSDLKKNMLGKVFTVDNSKDYRVLEEVFYGSETFNSISKEKYVFPKPVKFNAQNSSNRSGYGNKYYGENLIYEGTLYGETTDYMFVAAEYQKIRTKYC